MSERAELYAKRKDNSLFPVEIGLTHLNMTGDARVLATVTDITAQKAAQQKLENQEISAVGYVEPSEPVKRSTAADFDSVALGQLVNIYSQEAIASYPAYLILQSGIEHELEPITIGIRQQEIEINWLTAFYAVEWAFFALAAFYLWWRLVMDQRARESSEQGAQEPK